jgi:hypothetical protein
LSSVPVAVTETAPKVKGVGMVTVPVKVGEASGAKAVEVKALEPSVPPPPILRVEVSVPAKVRVFETVKVLEMVPPAIVKPVPAEVRVSPLTDVGVIAPKVKVMAGVEVAVATLPEIPLAVTTEAEVTVPVPLSAMFPFNLLIACRMVSVAATVPAPETKLVISLPVTPVSEKEAEGRALSAVVP